jgi:pimeloyl-ACP methyl ester carboxylesterase
MDDLAYFPAQTQTYVGCLVSGLRVRWYERGPLGEPGGDPRDAPTVLCLHGFPELAVSWREQLDGLADSYRVVAPDMRGYGGTDAPARVRDYTIDILARDVAELIDALGVDKVHLVGHDWGAVIAWEVAQRHGARLHSLTAINCPPYQVMLRELRRFDQLRRSWYMFFFQLPWVPEWRIRHNPEVIEQAFRANARNTAPFTRERLEPYLRQVRERGLPGINYYRAALWHLPQRLVPISVPTRLIWGLRDPALGPWYADPSHYESWVERFDRVLLDEAGHYPAQEAADEVNQALREHFEAAGS